MSENSAGTTGSSIDGEEPSMEDILASIRKIISDDEVSELNMASPEEVKSENTVFDIEDMGLSDDLDFDFEDAPKNEHKSTEDLTDANNSLMDEFDSDELDSLLSFDELEIPDIDEPNIDLNEGNITPTSQVADSITHNDLNADDVSTLDTLNLIGQTEAGESVSLNLNDGDLDDMSADTLQLDNAGLDDGLDDISVLNDLEALMDEDLDLTSISDSNINEIRSDEGADLSKLNFDFDDDLTSHGDNDILDVDNVNLEPDSTIHTVSTETDIDLVKSLMADLTDDSFFDEDNSDEAGRETSSKANAETGHGDVETTNTNSLDTLVTDETHGENSIDAQTFEEDEAAVMDEILSMAMDDESVSENEDGLHISSEEAPTALEIADTETEDAEQLSDTNDEKSAEFDQITEIDEINAPIDDNLKVVSTTSALQDIARRAANTADEAETSGPRESMLNRVWDKMDGAIGNDEQSVNANSEDNEAIEADNSEAMEDIISDDADDVVQQDDNPADAVSAETETDKLEPLDANLLNESKETPEMPKAIRSETILNEVTEKATTGAFAELNNVVEEKAIYEERGARIGDLVQEALRPMLKEWLDANLKGIVERAVTKEVKRISTGK